MWHGHTYLELFVCACAATAVVLYAYALFAAWKASAPPTE